jgi:hypothetical protein
MTSTAHSRFNRVLPTLLNQQRRDLRRMTSDAASSLPSDERNRTVRGGDAKWLTDTHGPAKTVFEKTYLATHKSIGNLMWGIDDNLQGMEQLLSYDTPTVVSTQVVARSILEASLYVCLLLDPDLTPEERLLRGFAHRLHGAEIARKNHRAAGMEDDSVIAQGEVEQLRKFAGAAGILLIPARSGDKTNIVTRGGLSANLAVNVTDAAAKLMSSNRGIWQFGSGAAHSAEWFLETASPSLDRDDFIAVHTLRGGAASIAMYSVGVLMSVYGRYHGLDTEKPRKATDFRERAVVVMLDDLEKEYGGQFDLVWAESPSQE